MSHPVSPTDVEFSPQDRLDILTKARALLTEHGWTRARYYDPETDCFCVAGAVEEAVNPGLYTNDSDEADRMSDAFGAALSDDSWLLSGTVLGDLQTTARVGTAQQSHQFVGIIYYNDHIAETVDDMLDVFDRTIARLQSEASGE